MVFLKQQFPVAWKKDALLALLQLLLSSQSESASHARNIASSASSEAIYKLYDTFCINLCNMQVQGSEASYQMLFIW